MCKTYAPMASLRPQCASTTARHVLGRHWSVRYLLSPAYVLLGWLLYPRVWRLQGPLITIGLLACSALVLVPSPLIEPRYFTVPVFLWRLHAPPLVGMRAWLPQLVGFGLINVLILAIFLFRPYTWVDGSTARFMF